MNDFFLSSLRIQLMIKIYINDIVHLMRIFIFEYYFAQRSHQFHVLYLQSNSLCVYDTKIEH